ncbi:hypothetical protein [Limobrevibacterium gyesilva]|uniref:Uncharacterized protein n=1 Tax=Limobrevibacterium gyesilva TaxID=2991712 RepID=A0AA41YM11_9PROT|nr:hypothetical protein [Limobrevibacterium gyesilva]MCW3476361.1 hypothetical protein [Limobrevibacterium gyesilva]
MLGDILRGLTDSAEAEAVLAAVGDQGMLERIRQEAAAKGVTAGAWVAAAIRHLLDHGGEEVWLDLLGKMSGSPQPGAAAVQAVLAHAFPDPAKARVARPAPTQERRG